MSRWIDYDYPDRLYMIYQVAKDKQIDQKAIEKDWWVT